MSSESPIRYGFRAVAREPGLFLAELTWRWAWGAASLALAWWAGYSFLASIYLRAADEFRLRSGVPQLVAEALAYILVESFPTLLRLSFIVTPAVLLLWIFAASAGRAATLKALLGPTGSTHLPRTVGLHLWRVVVGVMAFVAIVASFLLGSYASAASDPPQPAVFILLFFPLATVFTVIRSRVNWLLLLANVYTARGERSGRAFTQANAVFRRRAADFIGVGTVVGVLRLVLMGVATIAGLFLGAGIGTLPAWLLWSAFLVLTLLYFAVSDYLYAVKLAAYVRIIEDDAKPAPVPLVPVAPAPAVPEQPTLA